MWFEDILDLVDDEDGEDDDPCEDLCYAKADRSGSTKAIDPRPI